MPQREKLLYDHNENVLYRHRVEDVEPIIDQVKQERQQLRNGFGKSGSMRKIGSIPLIILDQWFAEGFNAFDPNNKKEVIRRLKEMPKFMTVDKI